MVNVLESEESKGKGVNEQERYQKNIIGQVVSLDVSRVHPVADAIFHCLRAG